MGQKTYRYSIYFSLIKKRLNWILKFSSIKIKVRAKAKIDKTIFYINITNLDMDIKFNANYTMITS